jgi:undecaprenyl-diphosphatase
MTDHTTGTTWVRRWHLDSLRAAAALVVLVVTTVLVIDPPSEWEVSLFRAANDLPRQGEWALWPLQQAGMALAVPAGAIVLFFIVRHWRPPVTLVAGGIVFGWAGAKVVKEIVGRGRPAELLADVQRGFTVPLSGIGYPSGHAVVVFTLAVVFSPYVPRWLRLSLYGLGVIVAFSRVYVGAHMPLDVIGGAAYGIVIGSVVNLVSGIVAEKAKPEGLVDSWADVLGSATTA